jgi:hypothetical protein
MPKKQSREKTKLTFNVQKMSIKKNQRNDLDNSLARVIAKLDDKSDELMYLSLALSFDNGSELLEIFDECLPGVSSEQVYNY